MTTTPASPRQVERPENELLAHLTDNDLDLLTPIFDTWAGEEGHVLFEPGDRVDYTYFPCASSAVSLRVMFADGSNVETCLIGREGAVGGIVSEGHLPAFTQSVVQIPGHFLRVRTARLEEAKEASARIRNLFTRYADCLLSQVFQATACNASHSIEQRTAKWIVSALARSGGDTVPLTQEQLGGMLGVGRSYVNRVMGNWQSEGVVDWRRGSVIVRDLPSLREKQCGCNSAVASHFATVLSEVNTGGGGS
ncbi:MAG: Crp/Fnr family transcriptional regulator [Neomegalonema sp.]|nr:Crp/Fnr family transcriptional regulator [Neomegalonema sp.]